MGLESRYQRVREGRWQLWVRGEEWNRGLWAEVVPRLNLAVRSKHPQTSRFHYPAGEHGREYYLKIYHSFSLPSLVKDLFRDSKAFRALKQAESLSALKIAVPVTVAAGEERKSRFLERAFLLTLGIPGASLPLFLRGLRSSPPDRALVRKKRRYLKQLASEIRRMHEEGFVHGDLVPSNILVQADKDRFAFHFIDHDRTRHYPCWLPQRLWRRNLVQLNRFVLAGISLQDRMRFLRAYLGRPPRDGNDRQLVAWLETMTRKRRRECDRIEAGVSFRELMRWNGPFAGDSLSTER